MPSEITVQQYRPSEIIAIFNELLSRQTAQQSGHLVYIRGIYLASGNHSYYGGYYDKLRDEDRQDEITIFVSEQQRQGLTSGNLVEIGGTLGRKIDQKGYIQLIFNVSRIEVVQNQVIDEDEQKRLEFRLKKVQKGFKNVDSILESLIYNDTRPKIALILASSSITLKDFEDGIRAARAHLDFEEHRVTFTQTANLINTLKALDEKNFHAIAMVRGGGIDAKTDVDKPEVIEAVVSLKTPFIAATGHKDESIFLRQVADKWTATPQGLGQYFSELVESVSEKKTKSRAVLAEQIKKQFQKQIDDSNKKNKELLTQIEKMTKQQLEQTKANKENIDKINEQNKKNLEAQQKKNEEALSKFQAQSKLQISISKKQNEELQKQLANLSKSQKESLDKLTEQNKQTNTLLEKERQHSRELERKLAEKPNYTTTFIIIAIIAAIVGFVIALFIK